MSTKARKKLLIHKQTSTYPYKRYKDTGTHIPKITFVVRLLSYFRKNCGLPLQPENHKAGTAAGHQKIQRYGKKKQQDIHPHIFGNAYGIRSVRDGHVSPYTAFNGRLFQHFGINGAARTDGKHDRTCHRAACIRASQRPLREEKASRDRHGAVSCRHHRLHPVHGHQPVHHPEARAGNGRGRRHRDSPFCRFRHVHGTRTGHDACRHWRDKRRGSSDCTCNRAPLMFSICFGLNALAIAITAALSVRFKTMQGALMTGSCGMAVISIILCAAMCLGCGFWIYESLIFCLLLMLGLTFTSSNTLAMDAGRSNAGAASALLGASGFALGGIVSPLAGIGNIMVSTGLLFAVCSILSLVCTVLADKRRPEQLLAAPVAYMDLK